MQAQSRQCAHCALLQPARSCAHRASWQEECVTFPPHPGEPGELPSQLTPSPERGDQGSPLPYAQWLHAREMCPVCSLPQGAPSLPRCPLPAWSCSRCHSTACCKLVPGVIRIGERDLQLCLREAMSAQVLLAFGGS